MGLAQLALKFGANRSRFRAASWVPRGASVAPRGAPELAFWQPPLIVPEATEAPPRQKYNSQIVLRSLI